MLPVSVKELDSDDLYFGFCKSSITVEINDYDYNDPDYEKQYHFTYSFPPLQDLSTKTANASRNVPLPQRKGENILKKMYHKKMTIIMKFDLKAKMQKKMNI